MTQEEILSLSGPDLDAAVARVLGLNVVGMARCWAPEGDWIVCSDQKDGGTIRPVYVDQDEVPGDPDLVSPLVCGYQRWQLLVVPEYSTADGTLSPMLAWLKERGWWLRIYTPTSDESFVCEALTEFGSFPSVRDVEGGTLNEAVARALVAIAAPPAQGVTQS